MRTKRLLIISTIGLALLLIGSFALLATAPQPLTVNVKFDPDTIDLGAPGSVLKEVLITLWFSQGKYDGRDIDPKTVLIEGALGPKGGWKATWTEHIKIDKAVRWVFRFKVSGGAIRDILWTKVIHMGGTVNVALTVTGNLYDATAFTGIGYITAIVPTVVPENPPPPI